MKEFITKYQKAIVGAGAVSVLLICFLQQKELSKLRSEQTIEVLIGGDIEKANLIDSLQSELFIQQTIIGRYELSLQHLHEVNPAAELDFQKFMNNKTE